MENTKEKALNGTLYGVHKEAIKKHHAFEKCIHQAMDIYANDQTTQLREENKKLVERLQKMTYYVKLFTGGGGHPESQCKMEIDKAEQLLKETNKTV